MKKICLLLCCILILQLLCSCSGNKEEFEYPVNFYYVNNEIFYNSASGVIQAEKREGKLFQNNLTAFLYTYLLGPASTELQSLIPTDVYLVSCSASDDVVNIVFNSRFSNLTGVKLSTACAAILMSVYDYTGIDTIRISAKDSKLEDKDVIVLSMDDIVLMDSENDKQ